MVALDHDRRDLLGEFAYFRDPSLAGRHRSTTIQAARRATRRCASISPISSMPAFITEFRYHDDSLPYNAEFTPASFSPCQYAKQIPSDVAVLSVSGWMDGAGYRSGAISRFLTLPNRNKHLLLRCAHQRVALAPRRNPRILARRRAVAVFRHLPHGAGDWALTGIASPLFHGARRGLARSRAIATSPDDVAAAPRRGRYAFGIARSERGGSPPRRFRFRNRDAHAIRRAGRARYPRLSR
jgi:hypothetical protein